MWLTILLDLLKGFAKHWFIYLVILLILGLGLTVYIQRREVKTQNTTIAALNKTISQDSAALSLWESTDASLRTTIGKQSASILALQKAGQTYDAQIAAAQRAAMTAESQYQTELQYEKDHPAPANCAGAMQYLLESALKGPPGAPK